MRRFLRLAVLLTCTAAAADTVVDSALTIEDFLQVGADLTDLRQLPSGEWVVTERDGDVHLVSGGATPTAALAGTLAVDSSAPELGLWAVEVHPDFVSNRRLFFYLAVPSSAGGSDANRFRVISVELGTSGQLSLGTRAELAGGIAGPGNPGGALLIAEGKLYVGTGDSSCETVGGNPASEPLLIRNYFGTCLSNPNGKVLRLELSGATPSTNPLVGVSSVAACDSSCQVNATSSGATPDPRSYAWGFRNVRGLVRDPKSGAVWAIDSGEGTQEELNLVAAGGHYGWPWMQGTAGQDLCANLADDTPGSGACLAPAYSCRATGTGGTGDTGCAALVGGAVLEHCSWPATLQRLLLVGDSGGAIYSLQLEAGTSFAPNPRKAFANVTGGQPRAVRIGADQAVYLAVSSGRIARIRPNFPVSCPDGGTDSPPGGGIGSGPGVTTPYKPPAGCGGCTQGAGAGLLAALLSLLVLRPRNR